MTSITKNGIIYEAGFSTDKVYRYVLMRTKEDSLNLFETVEDAEKQGKTINFLMLNPSTADDTKDDPTVAKCMKWAWNWGYDQLVVTNIFAFRATDPAELYQTPKNPIGDGNDYFLQIVAAQSKTVVCAWGTHGKYMDRGNYVLEKVLKPLKIDLFFLGLTKDGQPKHPLYLRNNTQLIKVVY